MKNKDGKTLLKGALAAVTAAVSFGIIPVLSKTLVISQMNSKSLIAGQCLTGAVILFFFLRARKTSFHLTAAQKRGLALIAAADACTMFLLYESYRFIDVGVATMAHFMYPVVVVLIMTVIFREKLTPAKLLALIFAIGGMFIMSGVQLGNAHGVVLALYSGIAYGIYNVANQKSATRELSPLVINFYNLTALTVIFTILAGATGTLTLPASGAEGLLLFINGLLKVGGASLTIYAMQKIGSTRTSIISMIEMVTAIVAGVIVFNEVLQGRQIIGGAGILIGAILVVLGDRSE